MFVIDSRVVGGSNSQHTSISVDSDDKIHICYYDGMNQDLKYATNSSGVWKNYTLDGSGDVGQQNSIAVDSNNKVHISYCDNTKNSLKYATNAGGAWTFDFVVRYAKSRMTSSIAIDSENRVYVCYQDPTSSELRYATRVNGSWTYHTIAAADTNYHSIAIGSGDSLHVSYINQDRALTYATNSNGTWTYQVLDNARCWWCSIALGGGDDAHISYLAGTQDDRNIVKCASNANGAWTNTTVFDGGVGSFNTGTSIAVDSENKTHIGFFDSISWNVMYATDESGSWAVYLVDAGQYVGEGTSMTVDSLNNIHFTYFDSGKRDLTYATATAGPSQPHTQD